MFRLENFGSIIFGVADEATLFSWHKKRDISSLSCYNVIDQETIERMD